MQLQREREQWVKEQSKLITVIKLQQHELHARGIKVEDKAGKIAQAFVEAVADFESRLVKIEHNVAAELLAIRSIAERIECRKPTNIPKEDRLCVIEAELRIISTKLDVAFRLSSNEYESVPK